MAGESQAAIGALHAAGWTDSAIGAMVGRNSSLIHQIAVGKKPGANLAGALDALRGTGLPGPRSARALPNVALPAAARRVRASGHPARVRMSRQAARELAGAGAPERMVTRPVRGEHGRFPAQRVRVLPNGQSRLEGHTVASGRLAADIADGMSGAARVKITYRDADGQWHVLGAKGGFTPEYLKSKMRGRPRGESLADVIAEIAGDTGYQGAEPDDAGDAEFWIV